MFLLDAGWLTTAIMFRLSSLRNSLRAPSLASRCFNTTATKLQSPTVGTSSATVEDMHDLSAEEILRDSGDRKDADLRHFTGEYTL